jgi:hypothetical protein
VAIQRFLCGSPLSVSIKDRVILALMTSFDLYEPHVRFYRADKLSSHITTLLNRPSLLQGGLLE